MKLLILVILFLMLFSCNPSQESGDKVFEINPQEFSEEQFTLSDIADDIDYIPIENAFPIGGAYSIEITSSSFYISIKDIGIVQFDKMGRFIKKIALRGKGPDELHYGMQFVVDEKKQKIYAVDQGKIMIYSFDGKFLGDFSTQNYFSGTASDIEMLGSNLFFSDYGTYGEYKFYWVIFNPQGNLITQKKSFDQPKGTVIPGQTFKSEGELMYYNYMNDTIFSISPDFKVTPAYIFSKGDYRWPKDGIKLVSTTQLMKTFRPGIMVDTKHFTLLHFGLQDRASFLLIDKKTMKTFQAYKKVKIGALNYNASINNDLDGGIPMESVLSYYDDKADEYIVCLINPFELKAHVASEAFKSSTPKYPEKKKALEKLANSLSENDNPVLMLVKLKE